jgi:hypothetical protein
LLRAFAAFQPVDDAGQVFAELGDVEHGNLYKNGL